MIKVISFLNVSYKKRKRKNSHYHTIRYAEEFKSACENGFVFLFTASLKIMCNGPLMIVASKFVKWTEKKRGIKRYANKASGV